MCVFAWVYMRVQACVPVCMPVFLDPYVCMCMFVYTGVCTYTYVYRHVYMCMCVRAVCLCVRAWECVHVGACASVSCTDNHH